MMSSSKSEKTPSQNIQHKKVDVAIYVLFNLICFTVFFYGVFIVFPAIFADSSWPLYIGAVTLATFSLCGIVLNLQYIRLRDSSIKQLVPVPLQKESEPENNHGKSGNAIANSSSKESFSGQLDLEEEKKWRHCDACETLVPERAWHCEICKICILRRDHHCSLAMRCIGEKNHAEFLGFLFHLVTGLLYASIISYIYAINIEKETTWLWLFHSIFPLYYFFYGFSVFKLLSSLSVGGLCIACIIFRVYLCLALKGQTVADSSKGIKRTASDKLYSYANLRTFLGPNPIFRIVWPFHFMKSKQ